MKGNTALNPIKNKTIRLNDKVGALIDNITDNWLLSIKETNPAILSMFKDSDHNPLRVLLPWSGEFAGKYLTNAIQIYSMTRDKRLFDYIESFIAEMLSYQKEDGYMGPWAKPCRLTGMGPDQSYVFDRDSTPAGTQTWDAWAHYHTMYALILWYNITMDKKVLKALIKIGDLFCSLFFGENGHRLHDIGDQDMNLSPFHSFVLLYDLTGDKKYLDFARGVEKDFEKPPAGDYIRCALNGIEFFQTPKPRWESLHAIQGIAEMYLATGEENYKKAFEQIWWSILKTDVHNTGGFSTYEQAMGTPYGYGPIETCCVIAHMATSVDMLRLSGNSVAADALEIATYNTSLGSFSPTGRWSTYNTPMEGYKRANYHEIGFQCRPGSPDLNCCSVNAPRAFSMITDWGYMTDATGALCIHYYGQGEACLGTDEGDIKVTQNTGYPYDGKVLITISGLKGVQKTIKLRIPFWSENTLVSINGEPAQKAGAASYFEISRLWNEADSIELTMDMSLHFWAGEMDFEGKCSIYRGPILMCFDPYYNFDIDFNSRPSFDAKTLKLAEIDTESTPGALFKFNSSDGKEVTLCDLYTAGVTGNPYTTWHEAGNVKKTEFSQKNLTRSAKV